MLALSAQNQSAVYDTEKFITTVSLAFPSSCVLQLAFAEVSHQVRPQPSLGCLQDYLPAHKTDVLLVCCGPIMVVVGIRVTKATTIAELGLFRLK